MCVEERVVCVVFVIVWKIVGVGKLGDLDLDLELGEDPSLFYFAK